MTLQLNERTILGTFDDLCERGILVYGDTKAITLDDRGFAFEFRVCDSLLKKPQLQDTPDSSSKTTERKTFGPASDLEFPDERVLLATVNGTHHFILNKFCVYRPQYMLITTDSYRRQDDLLELDDFQAVLDVSGCLDGSHYTFYNCTELAGSSRRHKHLQILKRPGDFSLFPDLPGDHTTKVPYRYFIHHCGATTPSAQQLLDAYKAMLSNARQTLGIRSDSEADACPHNMVLVKEWMVLIPRRRANVSGVSANAAGMMGMVWVTDEAKFRLWNSLGPSWVLSQLGVAHEETDSSNVSI